MNANDDYWLMLMEGAAIEAAHRLKARGGAGRKTRVPPGVAQRIDNIRKQQGQAPLYSESEKVA